MDDYAWWQFMRFVKRVLVVVGAAVCFVFLFSGCAHMGTRLVETDAQGNKMDFSTSTYGFFGGKINETAGAMDYSQKDAWTLKVGAVASGVDGGDGVDAVSALLKPVADELRRGGVAP